MTWLRRRNERAPALPPQVRAGLVLRRGERVLAHAERADGGWVIATSAVFVLVEPIHGPLRGPGTPSLRRPWHEVAEATWSPDTHQIEVRWVDGGPPTTVRLGELVGLLPDVVRERVMSTYILSQRVPVRGRRGVTVAVRRDALSGTLFTQAVPDHGIDPDRPHVVEQVEALTRDLAEQAGMAT